MFTRTHTQPRRFFHAGFLSFALIICLALGACDPASLINLDQQPDISVRIKADFDQSPSGRSKPNAAKQASCPTPAPSEDSPDYTAGLDCDNDGGTIQYVTPSSYKVAIKRLAFLRADGGEPFEAIPDTGTLENAQVLDITSAVELAIDAPPAGTYSQSLVELYYFELTMPLYDATTQQTLRIYMSDDDLPAEGNLGHHQGDITFIDATGDEIGFVNAGSPWQEGALFFARGTMNGAGGTDPQTGHLRGLFGDESFWNQDAFNQGTESDICRIISPLNLTVGDTDQAVTFTFNVADSWFYEDLDGNSVFSPCATSPGDACAANAAWAPLFAEPEAIVESAASSDGNATDDAQ